MTQLPHAHFEIESDHNGDFDYAIYNTEKERIGRIAVSTIPGDDKLYVMVFDIKEAFRKKGFGLAALSFVSQQHGDVIVPVNDHSNGYWGKLRNRNDMPFTVEEAIGRTDFDLLVGNVGQRPSL